MSSAADTMLKDGNLSFEGGQDAGRSASIIDRNQVAAATNTTMRGGFIRPRPAMVKCNFTFSDNKTQTDFRQSRFQHASFFDGSGSPMLLSSHGGRFFKVDLLKKTISEITPFAHKSTSTTADFTIPDAGSSVDVSIVSSYKMVPSVASGNLIQTVPLTIGGVSYQLVKVTGENLITVKALAGASSGSVVASGAGVQFGYLDTNSERNQMGWSVQAENFWIYQDNQSLPVIFNGSIARRAIPSRIEVPVGNVMGYTMGRLAVALPDRTSFRIGDLVFGSGNRADMLRFTENAFLNEGGDFAVPSGYGFITSMKPLSMMDTQLGQGPLMVSTPQVVCSLSLPFDRTTWKNLTNPLQTITPILGPLSQDSTVNVNTDMWYRSNDYGIHSFVLARRDYTSYGNTPQSTELGKTLTYDSAWLAEYASGVLFDNRLLMTCSPVPSIRGVWHRGLVALDFNLVSSLRGKTSPAWEGIWSGLRILKIITGTVNGSPRCFIYALNQNLEIEIWEFDSTATMDNYNTPINWTVNLPSYNYADGFALKCQGSGELFVDEVNGQVSINVKYRSDQNPCWNDWQTFNFCATMTDCGPFDCSGPKVFRPQFRSKLKLHAPKDDFDKINGRKTRTGYEIQPRLEISGSCQIRQIRLLAIPETESANAERAMPSTV